MRKEWEYKALGEVCELKAGKNIKASELSQNRTDGMYPCFGGNGIRGYIAKKSHNGIFPIIGRQGALCGNVQLAKGEFYATEHAVVCTPSSALNPHYLFFCLVEMRLGQYAKGVAQPGLAVSVIEPLSIPLPPLAVQEQIVAELDKLNELLAIKKQQLADYDALAQSLFYEMFGDPVNNEKGWEVKKLGEVTNLICNGNTPKGGQEVYSDSGILFLRSQNVWNNKLVLDDVAYINEEINKSLRKSSLKRNDILITKTGRFNTENSSLGRSALFLGEDGSANINGHVYLVRLVDGIVHKYVLYILISDSYRNLIRKVCVGGIDKRQLNKEQIEDFPIILPPLSLQQSFATRIEAIEAQKLKVKAAITDLETLLAARMQYWFD